MAAAPVAVALAAAPALAGRVALVTGAAQGLGLAIARALGEAGARLVLADSQPAVQEVAAAFAADGLAAHAVVADVATEAGWQRMLQAGCDAHGFVDVLVNNAARTASTPLWDISVEEWDALMAVNLRGCFLGCRALGAHMRARGEGGRILNMASLAGQQASAATGLHYAASKAGILALTRGFATELAPDRITVNALAPAAIRSPALDGLPEVRQQALLGAIPLGRFGEPEEVGAAAVFLASGAGAFITGATLDVNGGRLMR
ncbi:SDR family NAD(P)-dependent oxidoreductase [Pseudacidovorax sp. RU35E]|uniref:SDR family NAD(P)-dependent oxidoreductase n=1 Tax=Pseudacidovorax sp. RU35E TaxID=1907403 RepID=UPI00095699E6|nr:SDR family NAD(P)-dependent oxidoreductase [Pseudacidovorax sp. RU35E]SIR49797.1 3-oxoacyl-[acyl-carrier protein] reductase [Pseudacidovorax sp. RU35E]